MTSLATHRRVQALDLRIRLELLAARSFDLTCQPIVLGRQSRMAARLPYAIARVPSSELPEAYRVARLALYVYRRTSDVLHGRLSSLDLPDTVIAEWAEIVQRLETIARTNDSAASERHDESERRIDFAARPQTVEPQVAVDCPG